MNRKTEDAVEKGGYCCIVGFLKENAGKPRRIVVTESGIPLRTLAYWYSKFAKGKHMGFACEECAEKGDSRG